MARRMRWRAKGRAQGQVVVRLAALHRVHRRRRRGRLAVPREVRVGRSDGRGVRRRAMRRCRCDRRRLSERRCGAVRRAVVHRRMPIRALAVVQRRSKQLGCPRSPPGVRLLATTRAPQRARPRRRCGPRGRRADEARGKRHLPRRRGRLVVRLMPAEREGPQIGRCAGCPRTLGRRVRRRGRRGSRCRMRRTQLLQRVIA